MLRGIPASSGITIGKVYLYLEEKIQYNPQTISQEEVSGYIEKIHQAAQLSREQLLSIIQKVGATGETEKVKILEAHTEIIQDEVFIEEITDSISAKLQHPETAIKEVTDRYIEIFSTMTDDYMRERAADIRDVSLRLTKNLLGIPIRTLADITDEVIIVTHDLTPSDTAQLNTDFVKGFCTEIGGATSHSAIIARMHGIPAVVGAVGIVPAVQDGDTIIIDGTTGEIHINPNNETLDRYSKAAQKFETYKKTLSKLKDLPAVTEDGGKTIQLAANIASVEDCEAALENGAEGVGLFRTEFLFLGRESLPDEEEQFDIYAAVAQAMAPNPVIIRTLDIGGDKTTPCINIEPELNPFLGWRAIRICLDNIELFKVQLRAILRASAFGNLKIMYPMITEIKELRQANSILDECRAELDLEGIFYDKSLEVGIMIEIPAAAIASDVLIKEADFFSIGANDLIQYTMAADRMNEKVAHLYQPFNISIIRLIKHVIDASHAAGKWTGMCGEMAGDDLAAPILLGLGLDEFSMSASSIPFVKNAIRCTTLEKSKELAETILRLETSEEVIEVLRTYQKTILG